MTVRALLVDDEPNALARLHDLLAADPDIQVAGECLDGASAVEAVQNLRPEVLFLDIQMPEMDGFEVLEALAQSGPLPLVVFATAYDSYAIQAFRVRALDYLLKPFSAARLAEAVARVKEAMALRQAQARNGELLALLEQVKHRPILCRHLPVTREGRTILLPVQEVEAIEAEANYAWAYRGPEAYPMRATLSGLEERLDTARFLRCHRSWILNLEQVRELEPGRKGGLVAVTRGGQRVPVSAANREELERALRGGS